MTIVDKPYNQTQCQQLQKIKDGLNLHQHTISNLIPQVGMQFVCGNSASENKLTIDSIAAFDGRITKLKHGIYIGEVELGCSATLANLLIEIQKYYKNIHTICCMKYSKTYIDQFEQRKYSMFELDRSNDTVNNCHQSLVQHVQHLKEKRNAIDIIYDKGGHGLEPIIRVLGSTPQSVLEKIINLKTDTVY